MAELQDSLQQGVLAQLPDKWVQPWWRTVNQSAVALATSAGAGATQLPSNAAQAGRRSWSLLGSLDGKSLALVDRRGLLSTVAASAGMATAIGWSVDWWFKMGADWVFPSQRSGVRQQLVKGAPVVETIVSTAGGEVRQRSFVAHPAAYGEHNKATENQNQLVIEISNHCGAAIAVALSVRPYDQQGLGRIDAISVADDTVFLSGSGLPDSPPNKILALQVDRSPGEVVFGTRGVDPANVLAQQARAVGTTPQTDENAMASVSCSLGMACVALVFPLVQGSVLRATMPLSYDQIAQHSPKSKTTNRSKTRGKSKNKTSAKSAQEQPQLATSQRSVTQLPDGERVASGWRKQSDTATRARLGSTQLSSAFQAAKTGLPLAVRGEIISAAPFGPATTSSDETLILIALAEAGYIAAVREVLIARAQVAGRRGNINWENRDVTASSLIAAAGLLTLHPDERLTRAFAEVAASSARWLLAMRRPQRRKPRDEQAFAEQSCQTRRGLHAAVELLELASADKAVRNLRQEIEKLPTTAWLSNDPAENSASDKSDDPTSSAASASTHSMRGLLVADAQGNGNNLVATAQRALSEITSGQTIGVRRLESLLISASKTWSWPTVARSPANLPTAEVPLAANAGHDLRINALVVRCVRAMLMDDSGSRFGAASRLSVAQIWPDSWLGAEVEIQNFAARCGKVSWAVRWHGTRPALLWEIKPHERDNTKRGGTGRDSSERNGQAPQLTLTAPGLDRTFVSHDWEGEALLEAPANPRPSFGL